jgi:hypothetical protein
MATSQEVSIAARGTKLSHLFFADDSLLFCRVTIQEWGNVMNLIHRYALASGQKINTTKTTLFFRSNTRVEGEVPLTRGKGSPFEGSNLDCLYLLHECFPPSNLP